MLSGSRYMFLFIDEKKDEGGRHQRRAYFTKDKDELTGYCAVRQFLLNMIPKVRVLKG
jgi:hypothetical protein